MVRRRAIVQCEYCDKRFTTKSLYKAHQKKVHGVKKWSCEFCGRRFAERGTLTNHVRTHTKETPFGCDLCGRKFGHRATLLNHKKTHNKFKDFGCDYCGKRFHRKSNMNRHIQVVHMAKGKKRRRRPAMSSRLAMPAMMSDSSDGSPMQHPVRMPPPPLPLNIVMQQMGFPSNFKSSDVTRSLMSLPKLPERVTLSVTYQQQQHHQHQQQHMKAAQHGGPRDFQSDSTALTSLGAPIPPPLNLFGRGNNTAARNNLKQHDPSLLRKLDAANMLPPSLKFRGQMQSLASGMQLRTVTPHGSSVRVPPQLPPKEHKSGCTPCPIKEEPIDGYPVPAAPPSLHQSRSTSPIITGCDDLMLKGEDDTPTPSPANINGGGFSFPGHPGGKWTSQDAMKHRSPTFKLPTPMHGMHGTPTGASLFGTPMGSTHKFVFGKRDSIPDRMKMGLSVADFAPDYVASAMTMTMCVPSPLLKQTFTYEQAQGT